MWHAFVISLFTSATSVVVVCLVGSVLTKVKTMKISIFRLFNNGSGSGKDCGKIATNVNSTTKKPLSTLCEKPIDKPAVAWRELISFWIFGLCTEFGYVVMICAAYDILSRFDNVRYYNCSTTYSVFFCVLLSLLMLNTHKFLLCFDFREFFYY